MEESQYPLYKIIVHKKSLKLSGSFMDLGGPTTKTCGYVKKILYLYRSGIITKLINLSQFCNHRIVSEGLQVGTSYRFVLYLIVTELQVLPHFIQTLFSTTNSQGFLVR